jgi:hypothetical protein
MIAFNINNAFFFIIVITIFLFDINSKATELLLVEPNKHVFVYLNHSASVVSVDDPEIADVDVQSPRKILVLGKSRGVTKINILSNSEKTVRVYKVIVTPWVDNKVTVNLGADTVKVLKCQPRCIQMKNPGQAPTVSKNRGASTNIGSQLPTGRALPPTSNRN